ncbi:hypothetical protein [Candidatus Spongiihabitans sp.]|uniref:hypothetical protein n=1 Tax=Candidatus Spongiihabitans sp. TaxID=3101308 RepID=UPI003C79F0FF
MTTLICRAMTTLICHPRRQAGNQSGVAAGTRSYISGKQQASSPCRHSRIKRRGYAAKEFGFAERFNNWIIRSNQTFYSRLPLSSQKESSPSGSPLPPNPSLPGLFRAIQLNICHAQRDSLFSVTLASQLAFVLSIHHYLSFVIARPILLLAGQSSY